MICKNVKIKFGFGKFEVVAKNCETNLNQKLTPSKPTKKQAEKNETPSKLLLLAGDVDVFQKKVAVFAVLVDVMASFEQAVVVLQAKMQQFKHACGVSWVDVRRAFFGVGVVFVEFGDQLGVCRLNNQRLQWCFEEHFLLFGVDRGVKEVEPVNFLVVGVEKVE